jgi:hypothetical protein
MDLRLAKLKAASFYLLQNVSTLNQYRNLSFGTVVCNHFASYQGYPNYSWQLIRYARGSFVLKKIIFLCGLMRNDLITGNFEYPYFRITNVNIRSVAV